MKLSISKSSIQKLNPCQSRFDNYVKNYGGTRKFTPRQFMNLKKITQSDKMWVAFRMMSRKAALLAAANIADSVRSIYEAEHPGDMRLQNAINAPRLVAKSDTPENRTAADAAHAAAANAANAARTTAAANAANAARTAAEAAAYYATANANATAAYAAYAYATTAGHACKKQEKLIRTIILRYWK